MQLRAGAKAVPLLLPKSQRELHKESLGFWVYVPGAGGALGRGMTTAWGRSRLAAKFPPRLGRCGTDFLPAKAPALRQSPSLLQ